MANPHKEGISAPKQIDWGKLGDEARARFESRKQEEEWTQERLAEEAEVSQPTVSNFLNREQPISRKCAKKLADALGLSFDDFLVDKRALHGPIFAYCGFTGCPSLCHAAIGGQLYVAPEFIRLRELSSDRCPYCDALIYGECPNCRVPISEESLRCPACKDPYVPLPEWLEEMPPDERAAACELANRMNEQLRRHLGNKP